MKYVDVGGARMSAIGLGTWQFGSRGVGLRDRVRRARGACHRPPGPRRRHHPLRHGRDLRLRPFRADPGPGARGPARRGLRRHQDLPRPARRAGGAAAGPGQRPAARDRSASTSTSSTSPTRSSRCRPRCPPSRSCSTRGSCATPGSRTTRWRAGRPPRRPWGGRCCRTRSAYNLVDRRPEKRAAAVGAGQRPVDHRLQPAGPGPAVRPVRRRAPSRAAWCARHSPAFLPENLRLAEPLLDVLRAGGRRPSTPRRRRWRWRG